jgi:uncharacterized protein YpmB
MMPDQRPQPIIDSDWCSTRLRKFCIIIITIIIIDTIYITIIITITVIVRHKQQQQQQQQQPVARPVFKRKVDDIDFGCEFNGVSISSSEK